MTVRSEDAMVGGKRNEAKCDQLLQITALMDASRPPAANLRKRWRTTLTGLADNWSSVQPPTVSPAGTPCYWTRRCRYQLR